jgi:hypothetical protein
MKDASTKDKKKLYRLKKKAEHNLINKIVQANQETVNQQREDALFKEQELKEQ